MRIASYVLRIVGILSIVLGIVLIIIGNTMNNDFYAQVEYFYSYGTMDSSGLSVMYFGIGIAAAGAIMLIISIIFSIRLRSQFNGTVHNQDYDEFDDMVAHLAGNRTIFDVFHSENEERVFSFYRNKTFIFKDGDEINRGKMEPLTWEAGHPTLWRITMDVHGAEKSYEVSKVEGDILVKGDEGEEIYYRG